MSISNLDFGLVFISCGCGICGIVLENISQPHRRTHKNLFLLAYGAITAKFLHEYYSNVGPNKLTMFALLATHLGRLYCMSSYYQNRLERNCGQYCVGHDHSTVRRTNNDDDTISICSSDICNML